MEVVFGGKGGGAQLIVMKPIIYWKLTNFSHGFRIKEDTRFDRRLVQRARVARNLL